MKSRRFFLAKILLVGFLGASIVCGVSYIAFLKPVTITGEDAATGVAQYIQALSYDNRFEVSHVVCDRSGVCSDAQRGQNPTATLYWRLFALSKMAPNSNEFRQTFEQIKKDPEPNYRIGLWLTYRALKETNNPELAAHWVKGMVRLILFLKTNEQTLSKERTATPINLMGIESPLRNAYPMMLATMALELVDIIEALSPNQDAGKDTPNYKLLIEDELKLSNLKASEWLEASKQLLPKIVPYLDSIDREDPKLRSDNSGDYSYESCWAMMVHARNWKVQNVDASHQVVEKFFQKNSFSTGKRDDYNFTSAQMIFPCVMAARELQLDKDAHALMQILFKNLDSPKRKLCAGNDALVSFYSRGDTKVCSGNVKSIADMAWFTYLAAGDTGQYILEKET